MRIQDLVLEEYAESYKISSELKGMLRKLSEVTKVNIRYIKMSFFIKFRHYSFQKMGTDWNGLERHILLELLVTLGYLRRYIFWPTMNDDVIRYVWNYKLGSTSKPSKKERIVFSFAIKTLREYLYGFLVGCQWPK